MEKRNERAINRMKNEMKEYLDTFQISPNKIRQVLVIDRNEVMERIIEFNGFGSLYM